MVDTYNEHFQRHHDRHQITADIQFAIARPNPSPLARGFAYPRDVMCSAIKNIEIFGVIK